MTTEAPYGSWKSAITADLIVSASIGIGQPMVDGDDAESTETNPPRRNFRRQLEEERDALRAERDRLQREVTFSRVLGSPFCMHYDSARRCRHDPDISPHIAIISSLTNRLTRFPRTLDHNGDQRTIIVYSGVADRLNVQEIGYGQSL